MASTKTAYTGRIFLTGTEVLTERLFAALPASPTVGELANISDGSTATWGANVTGLGANHILVRWNGTHWTCVGK